MPRLARAALAATFLTAVSTQAFAQDLVIWWNKSYYPEEDQQFDKTVAAFEKESGIDVEYVYYTNEDVPRKVLAALTAGDPPDLAYGFLFDLAHTSRWAHDGVLEDVSDVVEPLKENLLPTAHPGGDPAKRADRRALDLRHPGGAADRAHPRLEEHDRGGRPQPR